MRTNRLLPFLAIFILFISFSCVKEVNFDQAQDIVLTPIVDLNLVFFNLEAGNFYDQQTMTERLVIRDTTEIRFLDDGETQDNLKRVEFYFRFENSIPREFNVYFQFLDENENLTYFAETPVRQGTQNNPVITEFVENVEEDGIERLTMADRIVVSVSIPEANASLTGNLKMQSKATYFVEIAEEE